MNKGKAVLGRGMAALLSSSMANPARELKEEKLSEKKDQLKAKLQEKQSGPMGPVLVPLERVKANTHQPRKVFKEQDLSELASSIKENGIIQPLIVNYHPEDQSYEIIAGERRFRAAKMVGLEQVPVVVKNTTKKDKLVMAIIENVQRSDLNCVEEGLAYFQLMNEFNLTQEEVAKKIGKERSSIANHLRLLRLPKDILLLLQKESLSFGHGKILASLEDHDQASDLAQWAAENNVSVRQLEEKIKLQKNFKGQKKSASDFNLQKYKAVKQKIENRTGYHVEIKGKKNGSGSLTIKFSNDDEFNKIYEHLTR